MMLAHLAFVLCLGCVSCLQLGKCEYVTCVACLSNPSVVSFGSCLIEWCYVLCCVVTCLLDLSGLSGQSGHSSHPGHSSMSVGLCALGGSCLPLVDQVCLVDHMRLVCLLQRCQFCIAW